ncbi:MAG TPA: polysaccharide biosynthesis C-terminal domain-containing protein, partial [Bryobacteraceae bacterium]|nr:polysaccharide biosynthesis C-terminal domain-containing protein [Bryobacteraceae bacterium]
TSPLFWQIVPSSAGASLGLRVFERLDLFLLTMLGAAAAEVGAYGAAQNLTYAANIAAISIAPVVLSTVTRMQREGLSEAAGELSGNVLRVLSYFLPLIAVAAGSSEAIMGFLFGPQFRSAGTTSAILLISSFFVMWVNVSTSILIAHGRANWSSAVGLPLPIIVTPLVLFLVPRYGTAGAAAGSLLAMGAATAITVAMYRRIPEIRFPLPSVLRALVVAIACGVLSRQWQTSGFALVFELFSLTVLVFVLLWIAGERPPLMARASSLSASSSR